MQEATTLKRVKPEPSDGTPANKRLKPDELERVVTPEGDSQQVEIDHVVDPETRAREAIRAAEAAGDIIDVDALDDAAAAPLVHQPTTAPKEIVVKAEKLQQAKDATAAHHAAEVAYQTGLGPRQGRGGAAGPGPHGQDQLRLRYRGRGRGALGGRARGVGRRARGT